MSAPPPPPPGPGFPPPGGEYGGQPQSPGYGTSPPPPGPPQPPYGAAPPPGGPPYGPPPPGGGPHWQQPQQDGPKQLGIASLALGIVGLPATCCCWFLGWVFPVAALVTGLIGYTRASNTPGSDAKPFSIAGIALGAVGLLIVVASFVWAIFYNGTSLYDEW